MKRQMRRSLRVLVAALVTVVTCFVSYFVCSIVGMMLIYSTDLFISQDGTTLLWPVPMAALFGLPLCLGFLAGRSLSRRPGRAVDAVSAAWPPRLA